MGYILRGLVVTVILAVLTPCALAYSGGDGTAGNPYQIADVNDFMELTADPNNWDMAFILTNDIVLDPNNNPAHVFTQAPIAPDVNSAESGFQGISFSGIFDGNGHTISNLAISASSKNYVGLLGYVATGGQVKNLGVEDTSIQGRYCVGGLAGLSYGTITSCYAMGSASGTSSVGGLVGGSEGMITSCYATGSVSGTGDYSNSVGGLVGINEFGTITSCYATGSVSGTGGDIGGLVGWNLSGTISGCYATGSVSGTGDYSVDVGGLVGVGHGTITSCYATGSVTGYSFVGGLVGQIPSGTITSCYATGSVSGRGEYVGGLVGLSSVTITSCYATGLVSGLRDAIGGLVGYNDYGSIAVCVWNIETSGLTDGVGNQNPDPVDVTGKTTVEMKTLATFAGWDFGDVWAICEGTNYPRLQWQIPAADWVCPDGVKMEDFGYLAGHWMETNNQADLSGDGVVDLADLVMFGEFWLN